MTVPGGINPLLLAATAPPPAEIVFSASKTYTVPNEEVTLSWNVSFSSSQSIDQGIGSVDTTGSVVVSVGGNYSGPVSRTYILTANGINGLTYTASITITAEIPGCRIYWPNGTCRKF